MSQKSHEIQGVSTEEDSTKVQGEQGNTQNRTVTPKTPKKIQSSGTNETTNLTEAASYVEAVMTNKLSAQLISPSQTSSGRKRHLSMPEEGTVKKLKNDNESVDRQVAKAKRVLYSRKKQIQEASAVDCQDKEIVTEIEGNTETEAQKVIVQNAVLENSENSISAVLIALKSMEAKIENQFSELKKTNDDIIKSLQVEISDVRKEFNDRMEGLTKKVESKVYDKVQKSVDEKVQKISKDLQAKGRKVEDNLKGLTDKVKKVEERIIPTVQEKLGDEIDVLNRRMKDLEGKLDGNHNVNSLPTNNFIIRNLPERERENTVAEVDRLLKDGLRLKDIKVERADRKENRKNDGKPGIIVAKCKSKEDKQAIMKCKNKLKDSKRYERVFIEHDMTKQQRIQNSNMRAIIKTLGPDKLQLNGSRVNVRDNAFDDRSGPNRQNREERDMESYDRYRRPTHHRSTNSYESRHPRDYSYDREHTHHRNRSGNGYDDARNDYDRRQHDSYRRRR